MDVEWLTLIATQATALAGAIWAVFRWAQERREDRRVEQNRLAALYVTPFLMAGEDLQSRLYNILCQGGLVPLRARPDYPYAEETVFLIARYFAWEALVIRFTPYGTNSEVLRLIQQIRNDFASAGSKDDVDPFCLFRPQQRALGEAVEIQREGEDGRVMDTTSLGRFQEVLNSGVDPLYVDDAVSSLVDAESVDQLEERTRTRLADVQSHLVELLEHLEGELRKLTGAESLSLFHDHDRRSKAVDCGAAPSGSATG